MTNKTLKKFAGLVTLAFVAVLLVPVAGLATGGGQDTCPEGNGWVKVDGLSGLSYTYTPPEGYTVSQNCMKVGSHDPVIGSGPTVTNSTLFNSPGNLPNGAVCTAPGVPVNGCALQNISHASFLLVPVGTTTVPEETTTVPEETTTVPEETTTVPEETTTVPEETTTVPDGTTIPEEPTTVPEEPTTVPETPRQVPSTIVDTPSELPFTGDIMGAIGLVAFAALALGVLIVLSARRRQEG